MSCRDGILINQETQNKIDDRLILLASSHFNGIDEIEALIGQGANLNAVCVKTGQTALHACTMPGREDVFRFLIESGIDVNVRDNNGNTALHLLSYVDDDRNVVQRMIWLINSGASVDITNEYKETAMHCAARNGYLERVQCLAERGADLAVRDRNRKTPASVAKHFQHPEIAEYLERFNENKALLKQIASDVNLEEGIRF